MVLGLVLLPVALLQAQVVSGSVSPGLCTQSAFRALAPLGWSFPWLS